MPVAGIVAVEPINRRDFARSCDSKQPYRKATAIRVASYWRHKLGEMIHAYQCDYGGHWHVGHTHQQVKRR